jgi:hypothetical protein
MLTTDTNSKLLFTSDITITDPNCYFIIASNGITIDGGSQNVVIDGLTNYGGLIKNGTVQVNGYCTNVQNIKITVTNSTIEYYGGWVCQSYFNRGGSIDCTISDCLSNGNISSYSGGIVGRYANYESSHSLTISNCSTTGTIGDYGGGIVGEFANSQSSGNLTISNCSTTGTVGEYAGGIVAWYANNDSSGMCEAINCYSTGNINGANSGGIFGSNANYQSLGNCNALNCYSIGVINGSSSGGIFGSSANSDSSGNCSATNCYSRGLIGGQYAGGIFGASANFNSNFQDVRCLATNCYSTGSIQGASSGGIFGSGANGGEHDIMGSVLALHCYTCGYGSFNGIFCGEDTAGQPSRDNPSTNTGITGTNNYSEADNGNSGIWTNSNAISSSTRSFGLVIFFENFNIWLIPSVEQTNIPFLLLSFNNSLYSDVYSARINAGEFTNLNVSDQYVDFNNIKWYTNNNIVQVSNIEQNFGQLTSSTKDIYNIYVINGFGNSIYTIYGYNSNLFTLTVDKTNSNTNGYGANNNELFRLINRTDKKYIRRIKKNIDNL